MTQNISDFLPVNNKDELTTYQGILDSMAIISLTDDYGKIKYVNQKFCDVTRYSREEVIGQSIDIIRSGYHTADFYAQIYRELACGKVYKGEFLHRKKDGETYWEEATLYPFTDQDEKAYQYLSVGLDITNYKNAIQLKDQYLMITSHELQTPLHYLVSLSNQLSGSPLSAEQNDHLANIQNATNLLLRMVETIPDLNKIETGQIKFDNKIYNLKVIVNELVKIFTERVKNKKIELILHYEANLPEFVMGDPFRLKQVLIHLIENAIKYTIEGNIKLSCKLEKQDGEFGYLEFTLEDTGTGIAPENLGLIKEKFQRIQMDNTHILERQRPGLSLVKQLIKLQNGRFGISSREHVGTRVTFAIPYYHTENKNEIEQNEKMLVQQDNANYSLKVLIAEDVDINQMVIRKHMQKFGFVADFAENGKVALDKLASGNYDIILMDMQMPVMNGYETIKKIRSDFPAPKRYLPIISITASVLGDAPQRCLEAGANDYVPKPYNVAELRKKIETLVADNKANKKKFTDSTTINITMHNNGNNPNHESLIDLDYLQQLSDGDDDFSIDMISYFLANTPVVIQEMKEFYEAKDWMALRNVAHKFKPQLIFMGIKSIFQDVENIEQAAAKITQTDQIPTLIEKVGYVCNKAIKELKAELEVLVNKKDVL